jgi:hypothetical protein
MNSTKQHSTPHSDGNPGQGDGKKKRYFDPQIPKITFPQETRTHYTPWLVVRYAAGDDGSRPLPGGSVFWESPDVWVVSSLGVNQPVPGESNTLFARVTNLGLQDATGVVVKFWWADPSLAITEATAHLIGIGSSNIQSQCSAVVQCPTPWVPIVENNGHECLLAEAFIPAFDPLVSPMDPVDDRHVGQKNEQLIIIAKSRIFTTRLHAVNITGFTQSLTFEVQPLRIATLHPLLAAHARTLPARLLPPSAALPLTLHLNNTASFFTGPSAVFARRLLSMTLQEVAGTARDCFTPAQITQAAQFEPWETRTIEITGHVPPDAQVGQTFAFRILQRVGRMITGGYTVIVVVADH